MRRFGQSAGGRYGHILWTTDVRSSWRYWWTLKETWLLIMISRWLTKREWKTDRSSGGNASHRRGLIVSMSSVLQHMREPSNVWASCFSVSLAGITREEDRTKPLRLPSIIRICWSQLSSPVQETDHDSLLWTCIHDRALSDQHF